MSTPFVRFQQTRAECADLGEALSATFYGVDDPTPTPGFIYVGDCYIERRGSGFYLLIGRDDWESDDLAQLERILYAWALTEFPDEFGLTDERAARFLANVSAGPRGLEDFAAMMLANSAETNPGVCHSHDHCDANMAMFAALDENGDADLFAEVWDIARPYMRAT